MYSSFNACLGWQGCKGNSEFKNDKYKSTPSANTEASSCPRPIGRYLVAWSFRFNRSGMGTQRDLWIYQRLQEKNQGPWKVTLSKRENQKKKILQRELVRNLACLDCGSDGGKTSSMKIYNCKLALTVI